jgi:putative hydrolase of the HAD superfamily
LAFPDFGSPVIFFDIDETLVNQRQAEAAAAGQVLAAWGDLLPDGWTTADFCRAWRSLREKHLPEFLGGGVSYLEHHRRRMRELFLDGPALSDREADARYDLFLQGYRRAWRLFDDARPALDSLADRPLGVLSNGSRDQQRAKLERTGILARFSVVVISEEVGAGKPDRAIFRAACERAGLPPEECVYVGDRPGADARAACAAGLRGIWLDRSGIGGASGVEVVRSLTDLATLLGSDTGPTNRRGRAAPARHGRSPSPRGRHAPGNTEADHVPGNRGACPTFDPPEADPLEVVR